MTHTGCTRALGAVLMLLGMLVALPTWAGSTRLIVHYEQGAMKLGTTLGYAQVVGLRHGREILRVPAASVAAVREDLLRRPGVRAVVRDRQRTSPVPVGRREGPAVSAQLLAWSQPPVLDDSGNPLFSDPAFPEQSYWADPQRQPEHAGASVLGGAVKATRVVEPPRVAVLDSGVASYPEGPEWAGGVNMVSEEAGGWGPLPSSEWRILPQYSGRCDTSPARHGSQIGAMLAAPRDNGYGIAGVLPRTELYAARVLDCDGQGLVSDVADAIEWAAGIDSGRPGVDPLADPVDVISLSLGAEQPCTASEQQAIDGARARGVLVVASAGNDPTRDPRESSPANCDGVLSVTALDAAGDHVPDGVTVGPGADLAAQGFEVAVEDDRSGRWFASGTSFSAPIVTASAALAVANVPSLSVDELEQALLTTAQAPNLSATASVDEQDFGAGIVDALGTLEAVAGARTDPRGAALAPPLQQARSSALRAAMGAALEAEGLVADAGALRELTVAEPYPRSQVVLFAVPPDAGMQVASASELAATGDQRMVVGPLREDVDYGIQFCDGSLGERQCESRALVPLVAD